MQHTARTRGLARFTAQFLLIGGTIIGMWLVAALAIEHVPTVVLGVMLALILGTFVYRELR